MSEKPKQGSSSTFILLGVVITITLLGIFGVVFVAGQSGLRGGAAAPTLTDFNGITAIDPQEVPDFTLTNQDGAPTKLSDLRGKPTLIFFGFTNCPDICPTTLSQYKQIHEALGDGAVNLVFISIDGERDTPEALKARLEKSQTPYVVALTAAPDVVLKAGAPFNVVAEPGEKDANGNYNIAHTASLFLLNKDGQWVAKYAYGTVVDVMIEDLKTRL